MFSEMFKVEIFREIDDLTGEVWGNDPDYAEEYQEKTKGKSAQPTCTSGISFFAANHQSHLVSLKMMVLYLNDLLIILDCEFRELENKNERIVSICVVFRRERLL